MAARKTVYQSAQSLNSVPRHGVLTLAATVFRSVSIRDTWSFKMGLELNVTTTGFPGVGHGLQRLVVVGSDGLITLAALRWLRDQDAALAFLERNGKMLCVTGPVGSTSRVPRRCLSNTSRCPGTPTGRWALEVIHQMPLPFGLAKLGAIAWPVLRVPRPCGSLAQPNFTSLAVRSADSSPWYCVTIHRVDSTLSAGCIQV
jgi:hypothetical protein